MKSSLKPFESSKCRDAIGVNAIEALAPTLTRLCGYRPEVSHPQMGEATCNLGTIHAGINVNSVPDLCELMVDLRSVEGISHSELKAAIEKYCNAGVHIETLLDLPSVWTDPANSWFAAAAEITRGITGQQNSLTCATYLVILPMVKGF